MNDHYAQLTGYIRQQLQQGVPSQNIRQALLAANWDEALVDHTMMQLGTGQAASSLPQYPQTDNHQQLEATAAVPQKYRVWRAIGDTLSAIRRNFINVVLSILISYGIATGAYLLMILLFASTLLSTSFLGAAVPGLASLPGASVGVVVVFVVSVFVISALISALVLCTTAQSIYDGADGHKHPLKHTISLAFKGVLRVTLATALTYLAILGPFLIILIGGVALAATSNGSSTSIMVILASLVGFVWIIIAALRYGLSPIVALFEPELPICKTLGRSKHLLKKGGQWFMVKGFLLLLLIVILISAVTGQKNLQELSATNDIFTNLLLSLVSMVVVGVLVMLYRNRRIVRQ